MIGTSLRAVGMFEVSRHVNETEVLWDLRRVPQKGLTSMSSGAFEADIGPITDGRPLRARSTTVDTSW